MSNGNVTEAEILRAAAALRAGRLVAFPTETVYGLGADAANPAAVERIYAAKGRPANNPLIVHVADVEAARRYADGWPAIADRLAGAFWPGPVTLVVPRRMGPGGVSARAAAGGATVALRAPDHPVALRLLRAFDGAVAAPSANRSTRVSPTTADHVREELGDRVDVILDGGPCRVGIESTVLDLTVSPPTLLRPGGATVEQIERVAGPIRLGAGVAPATGPAPSPGMQSVHYAPRSAAYRFERGNWPAALSAARLPKGAGYILLHLPGQTTPAGAGRAVEMPASPVDYAARLYAELRDADARDPAAIFIEMPPDEPSWLAVRDRLMRAARGLNDPAR